MQLVIISIALLASIAACSVNFFSKETPKPKDRTEVTAPHQNPEGQK